MSLFPKETLKAAAAPMGSSGSHFETIWLLRFGLTVFLNGYQDTIITAILTLNILSPHTTTLFCPYSYGLTLQDLGMVLLSKFFRAPPAGPSFMSTIKQLWGSGRTAQGDQFSAILSSE